MSRSPEQNLKFKMLKEAMLGDGDALDAVFESAPGLVFDQEPFFYEDADPKVQTITDSWQTMYEFVIPTISGGTYHSELILVFTGTNTNKDYQFRFAINDTPTGLVLSRELKDADDTVQFTLFNEFSAPALSNTNFKVQCFIPGGGSPEATGLLWRYREKRVSTGATSARSIRT